MADRVLVRFDGLARPVAFVDSKVVQLCLSDVFREWHFREVATDEADPIITTRHVGQCYRIEADWLTPPLEREDHIDALCGFIAELIRAYVTENPGLLCLHGAAAEFNGRLVIFPNRYRAGKSVLSACLAAAGVRLFADDVLPIVDGTDNGMAPGIAPRLRLPLPDDLDAPTRAFIAERAGARGKRYLYLDLAPEELAIHGTTAPIGGFVLLERESGARPSIEPAGEGDVLKQVIWQNFARESEAQEILGRLHGLVDRARCYRLRYGRADEAVALLKETFASWPGESSTVRGTVAASPAPAEVTPARTFVRPGSYRRSEIAKETKVDGQRFLADSTGRAIYHLNPVASAIWHALAEPSTPEQIVDLLHAAFPDADRSQIKRDVEALLKNLAANHLVVREPGDGSTGRASSS